MNIDYDLITVGGGLGGSALAKVLAEHGMRVLVIEREHQFADRIRGEFLVPWGVAEARRIGLYDTLLERCGHEAPYFDLVGMGPVRDLKATTPQQLPALTLYHPEMQEAVLDAARKAGAEIWRGATVREVRPGKLPAVLVARDGRSEEVRARLVVCADGRTSMGRQWGGFTTRREKQKLLGAGVMFENLATAEDTSTMLVNPQLRRAALLFPQGAGRVRAYLMYGSGLDRLQGADDVSRFVDECVRSGLPRECYAAARAVGPLASFDMTETWVEHPCRDGVALIGDAAGSSDPTWGQGLSITLRDVRELSDKLLADKDWDLAGHRYAHAHDIYFQTEIRVDDWSFDLFFGEGPKADQLRERAFPLLAAQPDRIPDHGFSGLDLPSGEEVRKRFFGEI
jgi:2-polyprenyl-6-methoxyphenol hydroxylase-like FAD-dependent oxidoreductase